MPSGRAGQFRFGSKADISKWRPNVVARERFFLTENGEKDYRDYEQHDNIHLPRWSEANLIRTGHRIQPYVPGSIYSYSPSGGCDVRHKFTFLGKAPLSNVRFTPQKRTLPDDNWMSALCQRQTHSVQQLISAAINQCSN